MARCHRFATQSTGTPVYGRPQGGVNLRRGVLLHPRPHGGVRIARDADAGVTPALLRDLGVAAAPQPLCRMAVPQVVEATRRACPLFVPFARVPRWVCPVLSTIAGGPAATSRALQGSAVTSARREPQSAPGRTGVNIRVGRKSANSRAVGWASRARIVVVSTFVPPTAPAGLRPRIRHVRAWLVSAHACHVRRWPAPGNVVLPQAWLRAMGRMSSWDGRSMRPTRASPSCARSMSWSRKAARLPKQSGPSGRQSAHGSRVIAGCRPTTPMPHHPVRPDTRVPRRLAASLANPSCCGSASPSFPRAPVRRQFMHEADAAVRFSCAVGRGWRNAGSTESSGHAGEDLGWRTLSAMAVLLGIHRRVRGRQDRCDGIAEVPNRTARGE